MFALLKSHARLIVVVTSLSAAASLFLINIFPKSAMYFWCFGAAMIFVAFIVAVFWLQFRA